MKNKTKIITGIIFIALVIVLVIVLRSGPSEVTSFIIDYDVTKEIVSGDEESGESYRVVQVSDLENSRTDVYSMFLVKTQSLFENKDKTVTCTLLDDAECYEVTRNEVATTKGANILESISETTQKKHSVLVGELQRACDLFEVEVNLDELKNLEIDTLPLLFEGITEEAFLEGLDDLKDEIKSIHTSYCIDEETGAMLQQTKTIETTVNGKSATVTSIHKAQYMKINPKLKKDVFTPPATPQKIF